MKDFSRLDLRPDLKQNLTLEGFTEMTPIQEDAIPFALEGKDVVGQSKTGTGKTLAFAIPVVERINLDEKHVQALVLTPTRELARQVGKEFRKLAGSTINVTLVYGGASINPQIKRLKQGTHVVVGTPGRVMDHINRGTLKLDKVHSVVLDEADRMLDMGFIDDVEWIVSKTPKDRQTQLFSATMPERIQKLAQNYMQDPEVIQATTDEEEMTVGEVEQDYVEVDQDKKMDAFFQVVKQEDPEKALVFCSTKKWVDIFHDILKKRNFSVDKIHGDCSQKSRERALDNLREGKVNYLICTDVAARGLDIDDITHVINYDVPNQPDTYVHRIGRTARAGKYGKAITFINPAQIRDLWLIEHEARTNISPREVRI